MTYFKYKKRFRWIVPGAKVKRYIFLIIAGFAMTTLASFAIDNKVYKIVLFLLGQVAIVAGVAYIISKLWRSKPRGISTVTSADQIYKESKLDIGPKVVAIGGGTGLAAVLRALKKLTSNITAVVTVADNGGNSGILRKELGVLPPGDIRNCVIALSETEAVMEELLSYRFVEGTLDGYSMGNLVLVALSNMHGGFLKGIQRASDVFAVTGQVLPVTLDNVHLIAHMDDGEVVEGEALVGTAQRENGGYIKSVYLKPDDSTALPQVLKSIEDADIITFGPGSLYTSILPNILVPGVIQAIKKSKAMKIYISNLMTQAGETESYDVSSHIRAIEEHAGQQLFDYVIVNDNLKIPKDIMKRYKDQLARPVEVDESIVNNKKYTIIEENLIEDNDGRVRHSMVRLANIINKVYNKYK